MQDLLKMTNTYSYNKYGDYCFKLIRVLEYCALSRAIAEERKIDKNIPDYSVKDDFNRLGKIPGIKEAGIPVWAVGDLRNTIVHRHCDFTTMDYVISGYGIDVDSLIRFV